MSLRSGKGALKTKPTAAKLREMGRRGNDTARMNAKPKTKKYTDTVPF